jgi:L-threonylcarbamoyladenylate synthase
MSESAACAVAVLRRGGVIVHPAEAARGLGCDPRNEKAVRHLFGLKSRPAGAAALLIDADFVQLPAGVGPCPEEAIARAAASWPGPVTGAFPGKSEVPASIVGEHAGIALRVTAHRVARELCGAFGGALVSTSANRRGGPPMQTAAQVREAFAGELDALVAGELGGLERPTPIRDAISGEVVRN